MGDLRHGHTCLLSAAAITIIVEVNPAVTGLTIDMAAHSVARPCDECICKFFVQCKQISVARGGYDRGEKLGQER